MSCKKEDYREIAYAITGLILFVLLGIAGIVQINKSSEMYDYSKRITDTMMKCYNCNAAIKPTITLPNATVIKDGYSEALMFFTLGVGALLLMLLLPRLQTFNITSSGLTGTFANLPQQVDNIAHQLNASQTISAGEGGRVKSTNTVSLPKNFALIKGDLQDYTDDPQKGKWGGKSENNGRRLTAEVAKTAMKGFYKVTLTVANITDNKPLKGLVKFHLHNTFNNPDPVISSIDDKAVLKLTKVYGAFTVGAEADEGKTQLELDLAELKLSDEFKSFLES